MLNLMQVRAIRAQQHSPGEKKIKILFGCNEQPISKFKSAIHVYAVQRQKQRIKMLQL